MRSILIIAAATFATSAAAQQLPLPRHGGCPPGYRESGGYCVAGEDHEAITMTAEHAIAALVLMTPPALR
jgi:hypothetical protein